MKNKKLLWVLSILIGIPLLSILYIGTRHTESFSGKCSKAVYYALYKARTFVDPSFNIKYFPAQSTVKIDVVIPVVEKDLPVLGHTINSVRQMVMHPIGKIYLMAPESEAIRKVATDKNCVFVLENTVLSNFEAVRKTGGWILQQFLKFAADKIVEQDHYLVIDADTILIRPHVFITEDGKYLVNVHWNYEDARKQFAQKLLQVGPHYPLDFVVHHMLFSKSILKDMKEKISVLHGVSWEDALLKMTAEAGRNSLSEYQIYMTFLTQCTQEKYSLVASANIALSRNKLNAIPNIYGALAGDFKTISLHDYDVLGG